MQIWVLNMIEICAYLNLFLSSPKLCFGAFDDAALFFGNATQIYHQPTTWQQLNGFMHVKMKEDLLQFKASVRMRKKMFKVTLSVVSFLVPDGLD